MRSSKDLNNTSKRIDWGSSYRRGYRKSESDQWLSHRSTGKPISWRNCTYKNTQITTTTDGKGNFTIAPPSGSGQVMLTFTYVGYEPIERPADNKDHLNITLALANNNLDDVVVVGYGTQKKSMSRVP
ncbi:carboxypeptidase-like regulatory domain-containing protein [Sphingobacterium sp. E70]|uniref:carboxypeptidase-like regulatory domain-containing protein n=1 Tax=Sphingobacterium sp. E70 TaxID=2853439 RepID=UPI00211B8DF4|nr:carboxypeptidase-like regulatory domain-containing protein [Sphingobacterium sp. E70]ULT24275.1 carboxypeptidase-like regulatory domain-containing protein [Sphingobacterium sp. E70]